MSDLSNQKSGQTIISVLVIGELVTGGFVGNQVGQTKVGPEKNARLERERSPFLENNKPISQ